MRLKDVVRLKNDKSVGNIDSYIGLENVVSWDAKFIPSDIESDGDSNAFKKDDILYSKLRPYLAKGFLADRDGVCSTEFFVLQTNKKYNNRFLLYFLLSHNSVDYINSRVAGVKMPRTKWQDIATLEIPDLNIETQTKVVDYLDKKTEETDQKIELLNKQRDAYERLKKATINHVVTRGLDPNVPLRDSKVGSIGLIPENWLVQRLKDLGYMYGGLSGKSGEDFQCDDESKTKPFIQFTNILNNFYISPHQTARVIMSDGEEQNKVNKGDLLFLMSSEDYESIGKSAVMKIDLGEIYLNSFCRGLRLTSQNINPIYLNFLLNSDKMRDDVRIEAKGFTRINLKVNKISELKVAVPSIDEQMSIVAFLENKLAKIDKLIENINKRIDAYKRLKWSLINEVVTGKRNI